MIPGPMSMGPTRVVPTGYSLEIMANVTSRAWRFYLYYVVRFFMYLFCALLPFSIINQRVTMGSPGSTFNIDPSQFQNLLYLADYDPSQLPFSKSCGSGTDCVLPYMGCIRNSPSFLPHHSSVMLALLMNE